MRDVTNSLSTAVRGKFDEARVARWEAIYDALAAVRESILAEQALRDEAGALGYDPDRAIGGTNAKVQMSGRFNHLVFQANFGIAAYLDGRQIPPIMD